MADNRRKVGDIKDAKRQFHEMVVKQGVSNSPPRGDNSDMRKEMKDMAVTSPTLGINEDL